LDQLARYGPGTAHDVLSISTGLTLVMPLDGYSSQLA
jgi:hypothetical protein